MEFKWKLSASVAAAAVLSACGQADQAETGAAETEVADAVAPGGMDGGGVDEAADPMAGHGMTMMGAEGGEGEAGAVAQLDPQARAVADFLLIRGHTMAGEALYAAGERDMARPHLSHPQVELYSEAMDNLRQYGAESAAQAGDVIVELGEADATAAEISAAVDATFVELDKAVEAVDATLAQRAEALSAVLEAARAEYNVSINDGVVTDPAEFQDSWGFIRAARSAFEAWRDDFNSADEEAAGRFAQQLDHLLVLHNNPVPDGAPPDLAEFRTGVTQAQLALVPFQS